MPLRSGTLRIGGDTLQLLRSEDVVGDMSVRRLSPIEAAWRLESIAPTTPMLDTMLRADLSNLVQSLEGRRVSSLTLAELAEVVADALRSERLVALRTSRPMRVQREVIEEPLGPPPEELEDDTPSDVYVIAAAVKLIGDGDVPYVSSRVRILDPDTGEEVVATQTTDDEGVVRAIVPENKVYRIEIADLDVEAPAPPITPDPPHPHLLVRFVDPAGAPLANRAVVAKYLFDDGQTYDLETDEEGRIDAPAGLLGPYELTVDDQAFVVHSLCRRDRDDDDTGYELVTTTPADDTAGDAPTERLERLDHPQELDDLSEEDDLDADALDAGAPDADAIAAEVTS